MDLHFTINDPEKALRYFEDKLSFTTGPVELDHMMKEEPGFTIIDVRSAEDFAKGHVPGAVSLPEDSWASMAGLNKETLNVLYCYSEVCHLAARAAVDFAKAGFSVMELSGGFEGWKAHDLPVETSDGPSKVTENQAAMDLH